MNPIDWTKPVRTKGGKAVEIYCTDGVGLYPIRGRINPRQPDEAHSSWTINGELLTGICSDSSDLENIPERIKRTVWINVYDHSFGTWKSAERAKENRDANTVECIGCVKVELDFIKGEGL